MTGDRVLLPSHDDERVRRVGRALIDQGLGRGMSLFDPSRPAWSADTAEELHRRYNRRLVEGSDPFLVKMRRQIGEAPDDVILLVAELLTLQALPLRNLTRGKKRERVTQVLGWMRSPAALPGEVDAAFAEHTWNGGLGAHVWLWKWLADAVEFLRAWWTLSDQERAQALVDPWQWYEAVHGRRAMPSFTEGLLYLAFPSHFLPIVSTSDKKAIATTYVQRLKATTGNLDRDLNLITLSLQEETGQPVNFYRPPFEQEWKKQTARSGEQRAWLVRPRQGGSALVDRWRTMGFVSLAATHLGDLTAGASQQRVRAAVEAGYQHLDYAQRASLTSEYHAFLAQMEPGDVVASIADDQLFVGVVTGDPEYDPTDDGARLRRAVDWLTAGATAVDSLPAPVRAELDQQGAVVDLTSGLEVLIGLLGGQADDEHEEPRDRPSDVVLRLRAATPDLAARLHIGQTWLQELIDLLQGRKQIVLYGPPGTGKTYIAQAVARHVAERDAVRLVQFHPSYAYEDFFEGFRPVEGDGTSVGFAKTAGPLRRLAAEARDSPGQPYVLVVDEMNRANLAKVFGELYFLLEYRDEAIQLQYSPLEAFTLPPNVLIIGTMNTADRSIALVDAAIRRRFAFVELHPDDAPVRDVLGSWLAANGKAGDDRAELLRVLNEAIGEEDRDFKIGPSYLMKPHLDQLGSLERVWRYDLLPLLEEHYYGRLTRSAVLDRFGLAAIRRRLAATESLEVAVPGPIAQP